MAAFYFHHVFDFASRQADRGQIDWIPLLMKRLGFFERISEII